MRSRQTELRDRYLERVADNCRSGFSPLPDAVCLHRRHEQHSRLQPGLADARHFDQRLECCRVAGALAQLADVVALGQALRGLHHADVARAGDDDDAIAARPGERREISVVAKLAATRRAHRGAEIGVIGLRVHELVVRAARRHARRGEHAIAQHAETADIADVDDVAVLQCIRVELRHQDDAHRLRGAEHRHDVLQREGARRGQIREIEIAIALHQLRIQLGVIAEVFVRVDVELAHQPVDVTGLRIRFAEQVVVADHDRDRQIVFQQRRPHRAVSHLAHVPLRTAGAEAQCRAACRRRARRKPRCRYRSSSRDAMAPAELLPAPRGRDAQAAPAAADTHPSG